MSDATRTDGFLAVASLGDIPADGLLAVTTPAGERLCLLRCGGEVTAVRDECPHQAFPLSAGELHRDGTLECVWHGARFDCRTGAVKQGPATDPLQRHAVRIDGETILVGGPLP